MKKILFCSLLVVLLSTVAFSQSNPTSSKTDFAVISFYSVGLSNDISIIYSDRPTETIGRFKYGNELNTKLVELYSKLSSEGFEFESDMVCRITFIRKTK